MLKYPRVGAAQYKVRRTTNENEMIRLTDTTNLALFACEFIEGELIATNHEPYINGVSYGV